LGDKIQYADNMYAALKDADVLAVLTEWGEFKSLDLAQAAQLMRHKNIVDCRNLFDGNEAKKNGFNYKGIGK
jgi:UDPglucose 6-dehydrogenase